MPARPADKGFGDEVSHGEGVGIAVITESIKFIALLPVFDPDLLVAHGADQDQARVEVDVVCLQFVRKVSIASKVVVVITDHHGDLDVRTDYSELIENGLVRLYYVL